MNLVFLEIPAFSRLLADYLDDDAYRRLQAVLLADPEFGELMPGTGGFRKLRWEDGRRGKGKRGGLRVIYYYLESDRQIWFFTVYDKGEMADLSEGERRQLRRMMQAELAARRREQ